MCKHNIRQHRKPKQTALLTDPIELIQIYCLKYGDSNDVYENKDIRGTYTQIKNYAYSYFKKLYWKDIENDSDGENILISIYENEDNCLSVDAYPQGLEYSEYKPFIDLVNDFRFSDRPRYINGA